MELSTVHCQIWIMHWHFTPTSLYLSFCCVCTGKIDARITQCNIYNEENWKRLLHCFEKRKNTHHRLRANRHPVHLNGQPCGPDIFKLYFDCLQNIHFLWNDSEECAGASVNLLSSYIALFNSNIKNSNTSQEASHRKGSFQLSMGLIRTKMLQKAALLSASNMISSFRKECMLYNNTPIFCLKRTHLFGFDLVHFPMASSFLPPFFDPPQSPCIWKTVSFYSANQYPVDPSSVRTNPIKQVLF